MKHIWFFILLLYSPLVGFSQYQIHPDSITGVKWKPDNHENSGRDYAVSPDLEYGNLTRREAVETINNYGIHAVVLRYNEADRIEPDIEDPWPREAFDTAAFGLVKEIRQYSPGTSVYFWKRQWFNRNESQVDVFVDAMAHYINTAKAEGFDDVIAGVCPIETNLDNATETLSTALVVAREINKKTDDWLKDKTFFWPGAGMGQWFVNIDVGGESFFTSMQKECKYFAFIFKYMLSQDNNAGIHLNAEFEDLTTNGSKEEIKDFLRTKLGLNDLKAYLSAWESKYPRYANVIFWGDNGDGINAFMGRNNSIPVEAMQELFLEEYGWGGNFFNLVLANENAHPKRIGKTILLEGDGAVYENGEVYHIWAGWKADQTITAVEQESNKIPRVYPNPAQRMVHYDCGQHPALSVSLTDMAGRILWSKNGIGPRGSVDISYLDTGMYICRFKTGSRVYTRKIMKK